MKKRNMILAGILSASMMMSMGGAAAVYAEEATATEAAAAEESKSEETAAEKAETPAAEDAAGQTESNTSDQQKSGLPPVFGMGNRMMQPPMNGQAPQQGQNGRGMMPNENGAFGAKATAPFFKPNEKPETKPDADDAVKNERDPWGTTDTDPYDAANDPANGQGQMPQGFPRSLLFPFMTLYTRRVCLYNFPQYKSMFLF